MGPWLWGLQGLLLARCYTRFWQCVIWDSFRVNLRGSYSSGVCTVHRLFVCGYVRNFIEGCCHAGITTFKQLSVVDQCWKCSRQVPHSFVSWGRYECILVLQDGKQVLMNFLFVLS